MSTNQNAALEALRQAVTGRIERGEATAIVEIPIDPQKTFSELLTAYATAVARTQYWNEHGTHGDDRLMIAESAEREARDAVIRFHNQAVSDAQRS